jgi:hypothetical protein
MQRLPVPSGYDCPMSRVQTMVQLTDELVALLDREAGRS